MNRMRNQNIVNGHNRSVVVEQQSHNLSSNIELKENSTSKDMQKDSVIIDQNSSTDKFSTSGIVHNPLISHVWK